MRLIIILLIISFYFLKADENKNLLILNSYHKGFEVSDKIINNIEKVFYTREDINIDILYMDSKKINTREYISELRDLYTLQLKNRKFDLIITK